MDPALGVDPGLAFRGFILGFTIAAAVGPISLLVMRRTLAEGRVVGLASGLGVATVDATYGAMAAFGLGPWITTWGNWLGLVVFLLLGLGVYFDARRERAG